jgi:hypothetical protein
LKSDKRCGTAKAEGSKGPGPDGFIFTLYKKVCSLIIGGEIFDMIIEFFRHGKLLKGIKTSHVALIQKSKATNYRFSEYIPISLVHGFYKIIGKCYPPGLINVLPSLISPNQMAFLVGRKILNGFMIANRWSTV